jgi:hypothetical protein
MGITELGGGTWGGQIRQRPPATSSPTLVQRLLCTRLGRGTQKSGRRWINLSIRCYAHPNMSLYLALHLFPASNSIYIQIDTLVLASISNISLIWY